MASPISQIAFKVKRCEPELVVPANPTPREVKKLSNIDDQEGLRILFPFIWFYKNNTSNSKEGKDPVKVIREALGRALVYYYLLAGRLKEDSNNNDLVVDCNGQGVLFVEADADVKLEKLGPIQPPFPYLDEVLYNVPGSYGIIGCPLLLFQVTRMICGGFILALRFNHTMFDGFGLYQFMNTLAEMAKGAQHPSIPPVWRWELLLARNPPRATHIHHEYCQKINDDQQNLAQTDIVLRSFIFSSNQIAAIQKHLPSHLSTNCSRFELITACTWRCRTLALNMDQEEVVQLSCTFNGRFKNDNMDGLSLPLGYYGNAIAFPAAVSKAGALCKNTLGYTVELVKKAKLKMNAEYIRSVADFMVIRGRPSWKLKGSFCVSELTKFGIEEIDFGWGCPEYGGPPLSYLYCYYYVKYKNKGEDGILVPVCLPSAAMDRFEQELKKIIEEV